MEGPPKKQGAFHAHIYKRLNFNVLQTGKWKVY